MSHIINTCPLTTSKGGRESVGGERQCTLQQPQHSCQLSLIRGLLTLWTIVHQQTQVVDYCTTKCCLWSAMCKWARNASLTVTCFSQDVSELWQLSLLKSRHLSTPTFQLQRLCSELKQKQSVTCLQESRACDFPHHYIASCSDTLCSRLQSGRDTPGTGGGTEYTSFPARQCSGRAGTILRSRPVPNSQCKQCTVLITVHCNHCTAGDTDGIPAHKYTFSD